MSRYSFALLQAALLTLAISGCATQESPGKADLVQSAANGVVILRSAYPVDEAVERVKADIAEKGIMFFQDIDQSKLAADAGIELRPSRLLVFGNPPLGTQFMTSNPQSGIDWPVRVLIFEDKDGQVWAEYNDFEWIARRHGISDRGPQFKMAAEVVASITSSVAAK